VNRLTDVIAVATGGAHSCALLKSGSVSCWGENSTGQVGDGTVNNDRTEPVSVVGVSNAVAITAGMSGTCALLRDSTVWCWGGGWLGDGGASGSYTPVQVMGVTGAVAVAAGMMHACAMLKSGTVYCWGEIDGLFSSAIPVSVPGL
jgi:alpha-tubulin suppressor-like RCC1 family protein